MAEPGSTHIIQVIHEIKDSVDRPHRRRWLENIRYEDGRRARTRRYVDGAVKIMDLLRPEVSSGDIRSYEQLYDECVPFIRALSYFARDSQPLL